MRIFLFILLFVLGSFYGEAQAQSTSQDEIQVWNPTKVDWWVSIDDSITGGAQTCEMHWLYDDGLDLFLTLNNMNSLVFAFKTSPKDQNVKPDLKLTKGMALDAVLHVNDVKHKLGVADIDLPPVIVFMGISNTISHLEYLEEAQRVLLNLGGVIYNFPLENIKENMVYFKECMGSLGKEINRGEIEIPGADPEWQPQAQAGPQMSVPIAQDNSVTAVPLPAPVLDGDPDAVYPDADYPAAAEEAKEPAMTPEPVLEASVSKGDPDITKDLHVEGITEAEEVKSAAKSKSAAGKGEACEPAEDPYDEQGVAVIHNLTRKLQILENEKEELRLKLLSVSDKGMLSDIMKCDAQPDEFGSDPLGDNVAAEFESIISNLRAENDLLKEALDNAESNSGKGAEELSELRTRVNELLKDNQELQDKLFQYQLDFQKAEEKAEEEAESSSDSPFEEMMKDNGLIEEAGLEAEAADEPSSEEPAEESVDDDADGSEEAGEPETGDTADESEPDAEEQQ